MARFKTFADGGTILPSDLDAIEDDYECAFSTYKKCITASVFLSAPASGLHPMQLGNGGTGNSLFYFDPALYWADAPTQNTNPRSVFLNMQFAAAAPSAVSPGSMTLTVALYPVLTSTPTFGPFLSGSVTSVACPASGAVAAPTYSGDFAAPAAGYYGIQGNLSANAAASSSLQLIASVFVRQK